MRITLIAVLAVLLMVGSAQGAVFAKFDGIDGESKDQAHQKWIEVLSIDWGMHRPGDMVKEQSRGKGAVATLEDLTLTMEYEKSSPKLQDGLLKGVVFPTLEIELTATGKEAGATYLRYELTNAMVRSYSLTGGEVDRPIEAYGIVFEEIKVTYTEYDAKTGAPMGNVEYSWRKPPAAAKLK